MIKDSMGLPELILHRMLIPHSFRYEQSRFSFEIKNTYAAGTITRLKLIADGNDIPLDHIQYQVEDLPAKLASQISPHNPAPIPTGVLITISAQASANPKILVLWAETKEAGIIQFTVKNNHKLAIRKPTILSFMKKPLDLRLDIDLENPLPINNLLLGHNWSTDPITNPGDVPSDHPPLLVFPPVNDSLGYHWSDGVSPLSSRIVHHDLGWKAQQDNHIGTDEFLRYCESNQVQPLLVVDSTLTSAKEAARWVSYCNDSPQSLEGKTRCLNGHTAPYAVKTWIISGNAWQDWELTVTSALSYARKINQFVEVMRTVDGDLKIGILVKSLASDDPADQNSCWNELLLNEVGQTIDFVYWQIPIIEDAFVTEEIQVENSSKVQETFQSALEKMISRMQRQISRCIQNREVRQGIDASQFFDSLDSQIQTNSTRMAQIDRNLILLGTLKAIFEKANSIAFLTLGADERQTSPHGQIQCVIADLISGVDFSILPLTISSNSALAEPNANVCELDAWLLTAPGDHQIKMIMANRSHYQRLRVKLSSPQPGKLRLLEKSRTSSSLNPFIPNIHKSGDLYEMNLPPHSITYVSFEYSDQSS